MSIVERIAGAVHEKRDPLLNKRKLQAMVDAGRSPRVIVSAFDYETGQGDFVLMIPPAQHNWNESEVIPLEHDEGVAVFAREGIRPCHAIIRQADMELITRIQPSVPDLFALIPDPHSTIPLIPPIVDQI